MLPRGSIKNPWDKRETALNAAGTFRLQQSLRFF